MRPRADIARAAGEGRVEQAGAPPELYDTPANRLVAGFIGSPPRYEQDAQVHARVSGFKMPESGDGFPLSRE